MNSTRGSTPPNPNLDLQNRSMDLNKTLGIIGTPHEESIAMIVHQNMPNQEESKMLGNSGKPVTLETLSLTMFSKHVFQEQGIRDSRKLDTCEVSNSRMCRVRES
jgi:hypothetical protein